MADYSHELTNTDRKIYDKLNEYKEVKYIYVAGELTGDGTPNDKIEQVMEHNREKVLGVAENLLSKGYVPFVPHLAIEWEKMFSHDPKVWLQYDIMILKRMDALLVTSESSGVEQEIDFCREHGIPVLYSVDELERYNKTLTRSNTTIH